jgi:hypothetical protein
MLENTTFRKLDLFPFSSDGRKTATLRGPLNYVFSIFGIPDDGQVQDPSKSECYTPSSEPTTFSYVHCFTVTEETECVMERHYVTSRSHVSNLFCSDWVLQTGGNSPLLPRNCCKIVRRCVPPLLSSTRCQYLGRLQESVLLFEKLELCLCSVKHHIWRGIGKWTCISKHSLSWH